MQKIPTVYLRDENDRRYVTEVVNPGCEWVLEGLGTSTRKFDGTCVMLDEHGDWWARREVKPGRTAPANYVLVSTDDVTQKSMGWEPIGQSAFAKFHAEAIENIESIGEDERDIPWTPGTFELVGPKVNGNPENRDGHTLIRHSTAEVVGVPDLTFDGIRKTVLALADADGCEGIVWHHSDGIRYAKIKARDFAK